MVVVPAGEFMMGSPADERTATAMKTRCTGSRSPGRLQFRSSRLRSNEWDACVAVGACAHVPDSNMGRGTQPVINVTWDTPSSMWPGSPR